MNWRFPVPRWAKFLERHPRPHLVVGVTRRVVKCRDNAFLRLIEAQPPSGQFAFRRDFDQHRACYLVFVAFEDEIDALKFSQLVGRKRMLTKIQATPANASLLRLREPDGRPEARQTPQVRLA